MKKAIVVGASSGIGEELSRILSESGYVLGLAARRVELLNKLSADLPNKSFVKQIDLTSPDTAMRNMSDLIDDLDGVDLVVIVSGTGEVNPQLQWSLEHICIATNVVGFAAIANVAMNYFLEKKSGHLVGISSIAAVRGARYAPAYNASKSFVSNYLEGLRQKAKNAKYAITVTEIMPGYVNSDMAKGQKLFWMASINKAATQIYRAIKNKKSHAYVTKRWRLIAWLIKVLPAGIYNRF